MIIDIVRDLKSIVFPGYFSTDTSATVFPEYYVGHRLNDLYDRLKNQIEIALLYHGEEPEEAAAHADRTACGFFEQLPEIQRLLLTDVQAGFDGDPAAKSKEEIIFSYPGLFAIYVYRLTTEHCGIRIDRYIITDRRMTFYIGKLLSLSCGKRSQCHSLIQFYIISDFCSLTYNHTGTKVSAKSPELVIKKPKAQVSATNVWEY